MSDPFKDMMQMALQQKNYKVAIEMLTDALYQLETRVSKTDEQVKILIVRILVEDSIAAKEQKL